MEVSTFRLLLFVFFSTLFFAQTAQVRTTLRGSEAEEEEEETLEDDGAIIVGVVKEEER